MISNVIVFSTLILGVVFTVLYLIRPEFRARIEQPKTTFLQQLSMYDRSLETNQHDITEVSRNKDNGETISAGRAK